MCQSFRDNAREVQRDMDDASRLNISRNEVTITEDILLNLARVHSPHNLKIKTYTQIEEGINGADWEFWFCNSQGFGVAVRVQAKKLYKNGKYDSLFNNKNKGSIQCQKLIKNAGTSIPIYVFYNGLNNFVIPLKWLISQSCRPSCSMISDWGISMCSANTVNAALSDGNTYPINLNMVPWHYLVCPKSCTQNPSNFDLPSIVGASLQSLFMDGDRKYDQHNFDPTKKRPSWVGQLNEVGFGGEEALDSFMIESNLRGIAVIEQIDSEG